MCKNGNHGKKQVMFFIAIMAALLFSSLRILSWIFGIKRIGFPVEYAQKIPFGILGACIILACAFLWVRLARPASYDALNENTPGGIHDCTPLQKIEIAKYWITIFVALSAFLAFCL